MLEVRDILMRAHSDSRTLNDYAQLVAQQLPEHSLSASELAQTVLRITLDVRHSLEDYAESYPALYDFARRDNGRQLCQLAACLPLILQPEANTATASFIQSYADESCRYFGRPDASSINR